MDSSGLPPDDLLTLHELRLERRITSAQAAELFQVDAREARAVLNRLADRGPLEARCDCKGRVYHLDTALFRRLGEPGQYVRTRGFEDIEQEQIALGFRAATRVDHTPRSRRPVPNRPGAGQPAAAAPA
jgi:hypothetical protein